MAKKSEIVEFDIAPESDLLDEVLAVGDSSFFTDRVPTDVVAADSDSVVEPSAPRSSASPQRNGSVKGIAPARDGKSAFRALAAAGALLAAVAVVAVVLSGRGATSKPLEAQTPARTPVSAATGRTPIAAPKRPQVTEPVRKTRKSPANSKSKKRRVRSAKRKRSATARPVVPTTAPRSPAASSQPATPPPTGYSSEFGVERYGQ